MLDVKYAVFGALENNCYLITDTSTGKSALVDCTEDSEKMRNFISGTDLEYILLTHGHFDHIGGVKGIKELTNAKVVISREDEPMLSSSKHSLAAFCNAEQNNTKADIIIRDGDTITLGESIIKVIATPGHTKGGVCYLCDDKLFTGDTLFFCSCGRTDFPGGSDAQILASLKKLASLEGNPAVYPGHEELSTLDFERTNNPYMK
ncbi:MAG: MBL fold metallo-hydrolase [Eubacterium sp.]|nr:MBL fold metallo-hydrolase [Eubacterium sp.]